MMSKIIYSNIFFLGIFLFSCKKDVGDPNTHGYPAEVGQIVLTKCATSGCHNDESYLAAGELNLSSWEKLMDGSDDGAAVIPYRTDFSNFCFYINTFSDLGITLNPTMPLNNLPLTRTEANTIFTWIKNGAPDANGKVKFADNVTRKKFYVVNQGCKVVTVFDEETLLPMRYITVESGNATPHMIKISPDKNNWYVVSIGGNSIKKYRTSDDTYIGEINITTGNYNTFAISQDSKKAYILDFSNVGRIMEVDLLNMTLLNTYTSSDWSNIHGSCVSPNGQFLYITSQLQNRIFKIPLNDFSSYTEIVLNNSFSSTLQNVTNPHEIIFSPDSSKYFVSCTYSNEVRVFKASNDSLLASIPVGEYPVEFSFSPSHGYLFVTCMEDLANLTAPTTGKKGVVSVINYNTNTFVQHIDAGFYQPHGICVDENNGLLYVASRNQEINGPAPHHTTFCGGRNGYLNFIEINNLLPLNRKVEVSVDAYSIGIRN